MRLNNFIIDRAYLPGTNEEIPYVRLEEPDPAITSFEQNQEGGNVRKRTQKEIKNQTEGWLDERWNIAHMEDSRPQDVSYYNGALKALEFAGYEWKRDGNGKHTLYKL